MATIGFTMELHAELFVPISGDSPRALRHALLGALRAFGPMGWRSGEVPRGGFRFPLANEPDFDWRLIGARRGTCTIDGGTIKRNGPMRCAPSATS